MKKLTLAIAVTAVAFSLTACKESQRKADAKATERQLTQYAIGQPLPAFDWSMERHMVIELYRLRNTEVATHTVWRSDRGTIEGDCPSMGFGIPYSTSLTNPLKLSHNYRDSSVIEQAEINGVFPSKNTSATWTMCTNDIGSLEPIYIESRVTVYPYPVTVDYETNRVIKAGKASATISSK